MQVSFDVYAATFKLGDLLALELHKFEEEVGEIVDRAQKEEKMETGLAKLDETWAKVGAGAWQGIVGGTGLELSLLLIASPPPRQAHN